MMIINALIIFSIVIVLALIINGIESHFKSKKEESVTIVPFKELFDKSGLIIAPFKQGDKELFFLIDTGCNISQISQSSIDKIEYINSDKVIPVYGKEGNKINQPFIKTSITYDNINIYEEFSIIDIDTAFGMVEDECGIHIDGIIGLDIMQAYNMEINMKELFFTIK